MIYVLYGQPGSGKTTLGKLLADHLDTPFVIDGDEFRKMFSGVRRGWNPNRDTSQDSDLSRALKVSATDPYGREGREVNIRNANAVATYLNKMSNGTGHVVMSLVNPYTDLRVELRGNNVKEVTEILLESNRDLRREYHVGDFEKGAPDQIMNTDRDAEHTWQELKGVLKI